MRRSLIVAFLIAAASLAAWTKQPFSSSPAEHKVRKSARSAAPVPELASSQPAPAPSAVVSYQNGLLTITAQNATLQQIVEKVRDSTGATVEAPALNERVTVSLGPQPPAAVIAALLEGSHVNYVIVGGERDTVKVIQITPEPGGTPEPVAAPPPPREDTEAEAARAKAMFVAETGGDEGVWDNAPQSPPQTVVSPVPTPPTQLPSGEK